MKVFVLSYFFQKPKHLFKKEVRCKLLKVTVKLCVMSKSSFDGFSSKDTACETEVFLPTLFLENKVQIHTNN